MDNSSWFIFKHKKGSHKKLKRQQKEGTIARKEANRIQMKRPWFATVSWKEGEGGGRGREAVSKPVGRTPTSALDAGRASPSHVGTFRSDVAVGNLATQTQSKFG